MVPKFFETSDLLNTAGSNHDKIKPQQNSKRKLEDLQKARAEAIIGQAEVFRGDYPHEKFLTKFTSAKLKEIFSLEFPFAQILLEQSKIRNSITKTV